MERAYDAQRSPRIEDFRDRLADAYGLPVGAVFNISRIVNGFRWMGGGVVLLHFNVGGDSIMEVPTKDEIITWCFSCQVVVLLEHPN